MINIELRANSSKDLVKILYEQSLPNAYFLQKARQSYLALRNSRKLFLSVLGAPFKHRIPAKSTKCKKCDTKHTTEETLIYSVRADRRRQSNTLFCLSRGYAVLGQLKFVATLHRPMNDYKTLEYWFWGYKYILVSRRIHKHRICQPWESTINANEEHKTSFNPVARFIPIRIENSMDLIFPLATLVTSVNEPGFSLYHFKFDDVFSTQVPGIKQLKHSVF